MPIIIATFLRSTIQFAVTLGVVQFAATTIIPAINAWIADIARSMGVSDEIATDIAANEFLEFAEQIGIGALTLRTRVPLIVADRLGFSAKGWAMRKVPATTKTKTANTPGAAVATSVATNTEITAVAEMVAKTKGVSSSVVLKIFGVISATIGTTSLALLAVAQWIDFGNWNSGAYQGTFNRLYARFGLVPDQHQASPRVASQEMFDKVYNAMRNEGITEIRHPETGQVLPFTAPNAVIVIDKLASKLFIEKGKVTAAELLGLTLALTNFSNAAPARAAATSTAASASAASPQTIKVFTGIVSSGSIKAPTEFSARPDDLIMSVGELETAAANNLAPYLAALPNKVRYEIKVVSSITTRDGFTQRGTTQRVQNGVYANGSPKYKMVTNKFAVMRLYIVTDTGTRHKLTDITLGPTDAINFQPSANDISAVESYLQSSIHTSDAGAITSGDGSQPLATAEQGNSAAATGQANTRPTDRKITNPDYGGVIVAADTNFADIYRVVGSQLWHAYPYNDLYTEAEKIQLAGNASKFAGLRDRLAAIGIEPDRIARAQYITDYIVPAQRAGNEIGKSIWELFAATNTEQPVSATASPACSASNLSAFYAALGQSLPGIEARSKVYEAAGLGSAAYYVGTSEQNVKLLAALKVQNGCTA